MTDNSDSLMEIANHYEDRNLTLSLKKKPKPRGDEDPSGSVEMDCAEDGKSLRDVVELIQAGDLKKLKVDQCKAYLRKNGLRLSGNKDTLVQRIKEHLETVNGGGYMKYPESSFVLNCKGDACTGDIVLFEQNVYEMFNLASGSASGPPCGTRLVAGRIIKESYGSTKQQHTFTIEVLWSKGEKPLPPLYPLLIKGRNLYRMKTLRQRWADEEERRKVLQEKHSRGSLARSFREVRIQEKEMRKNLKAKRVSKESNKNPTSKPQQSASFSETTKPLIQSQQQSSHAASERLVSQYSQPGFLVSKGPPSVQSQGYGGFIGVPIVRRSIMYGNGQISCSNINSYENGTTKCYQMQPPQRDHYYLHCMNGQGSLGHNIPHRDELLGHRKPLSSLNYSLPVHPQKNEQVFARKELCRYYNAQGKCHFGHNCKFMHEVKGSFDQSKRYYRM